MTNSIFALIGVAAGASLTFLFGVANDRARYKREIGIRWDSRTYEAYLAYTQAAVLTARRPTAVVPKTFCMIVIPHVRRAGTIDS